MDQELLKKSSEDSPTATLITNAAGTILFFNKAATEMLGQIDPGTNFSSFISAEPASESLEESTAVKLALDKDAALEKLNAANGASIFVSILRTIPVDGMQFVYIRDITLQIGYIVKVKNQQKTAYELSRSLFIRSGKLEDALQEIALVSSETMDVSRMNIWEIDENFSSIRSLVNYDKDRGNFLENSTLYRYQFPNYFDRMQMEEILPTSDAMNDPKIAEIKENYLVPCGILSLIDIPIRIAGKMIGVVCFEDTKKLRDWNVAEQNFAVAIAQIIAQTMETHHRQKVQRDLEQALSEKKVLLAEINHRVKNNFSLISDLLRIQESKAKDEFHKKLFTEIQSRLLSMGMIHRQLYLSDSIGAVNFRDFLLDLSAHFRSTYSSKGIDISTRLDNCRLPIGKAVLCGLVINELMTNACQHAFGKTSSKSVTLKMTAIHENLNISVSDNGEGANGVEDGVGMELVNELVARLHGKIERVQTNGTSVSLNFSLS